MALHWFSPPVPVRTEGSGSTRKVSNAEAAAEELLKWTNHGLQWDLAVRVCIAVISDQMEPEEARKAFLAAAKEQGTLVPP
ncbi:MULTISPECIES: DUF982 domain-containing protein [unclassified Mesorhizobium]|uniref:DUF982 domain-containing protein n=1 Tax=unclassified Mesorhizobium TaxID=325217 RepID=UPI003339253F